MMPSDDEDQDDAYMRRMKAEGKERHEEMVVDDDDDEDESGMIGFIDVWMLLLLCLPVVFCVNTEHIWANYTVNQ